MLKLTIRHASPWRAAPTTSALRPAMPSAAPAMWVMTFASSSFLVCKDMGSFVMGRRQGNDRRSRTALLVAHEGAALAAGFPEEPDVGDGHGAVRGLAHVIDGEPGRRRGNKRFHLHAGPARHPDGGGDFHAGRSRVG